jgi:hypothetical protein
MSNVAWTVCLNKWRCTRRHTEKWETRSEDLQERGRERDQDCLGERQQLVVDHRKQFVSMFVSDDFVTRARSEENGSGGGCQSAFVRTQKEKVETTIVDDYGYDFGR